MEEVKGEVPEEAGVSGDDGGEGREADEAVSVLVVDDSPLDRMMVQRLLACSRCRFEVTSVSSAKEAMSILGLDDTNPEPSDPKRGLNIDVILTDFCMPEMTGYDLLKAVKNHISSRQIPVFIMSSENDPERISSCRAMGAEDFLLKPLKKNDALRLRTVALSAPRRTSRRSKLPADMIAGKSISEPGSDH